MDESDDFKALVSALQNASAYPHPVRELKIIKTAVSCVFLTGDYAYKINKPVNFSFLDFSTLEKRKKQCENEVKYNCLISPQLYLGVVPIIKSAFSTSISPFSTSVSPVAEFLSFCGSSSCDNGKIIEYAVKMKQIEPQATMDALLKKNAVHNNHIAKIAKKLAEFHALAPTGKEISFFGTAESIIFNWNENFEQTKKYVPEIISHENFSLIQQKINYFILKNEKLFEQRVLNNKIKHCHGDLHSGNIFIAEEGIYIFDGIVFNQRFPCSDIIAEIAFLAMDLDFYRRKDLADFFIETYQKISGDSDIPLLLNFYKCYRAYIRGKINCFASEDRWITKKDKSKIEGTARQYFNLARNYSQLL